VTTLVMTWPLTLGLGRDIPWDLGDSLLNCWILGWGADHLLRFVTGDPGAFRGFWNANIFHPSPLTLAYSEHLFAQAIQIAPIYAATRNLILCYDLVFLSTFVLSGFGVYLLVRDLTGRGAAAFVAGLVYAFAPYRIGQYSHLQVLSSQWMPFALFGFRRYFDSRGWRPLAGAAAATVAQNLSCGYFLVFFAPFLGAYILYELISRRLWRDWRVWRDVAIAGAAIAALTLPFVLPYLELRALGFARRNFDEVVGYSANVFSYFTAHGAQRLYGEWMRAFPKSEGDSFTAFTPLALAAMGLATHLVTNWRNSRTATEARWPRLRPIVWLAFAIVVTHIVLIAAVTFTGGLTIDVGPLTLRAANVWRLLLRILMALALLAALSPRARAFLRGLPRSAFAFYALALAAAFWLSLGPIPSAMGRRLTGAALYWYFYEYVPGFDGLRVPARMGMLVMLFLAVLAGYGAAAIQQRWRQGTSIVFAAGLLFLMEAAALPLEVNGTFTSEDFVSPPSRVLPADRAPDVYRFLATLPATAAVAEFPFGDDAYELRYMFYSTNHWRRLLNGYSGGFPDSYQYHRAALRLPLRQPDVAFDVLRKSGATHAVVHEAAFRGEEGAAVSDWLRGHGAQPLTAFGRDRVFVMPPE